ncbi:hypothetical protein O9Z70_04395 [Devosia sp. YIM 151766]|uniref:hypothetical protein n=1 Tax=Devosia sp. YIM 151766 TaxID=3017325 RepID=UPI00255CEF32|nr:hypothetical protein [Devosia sp. YIM 151766]WIY53789.1 hypothetical protein O9Z70_04395 [Devosia sp. YIM 151766]
MPNYRITLQRNGEHPSGDVITRDGEVIGTRRTDENDLDDFYQFIPDGGEEPIIQGYMLGLFCSKIADWHDSKSDPK